MHEKGKVAHDSTIFKWVNTGDGISDKVYEKKERGNVHEKKSCA